MSIQNFFVRDVTIIHPAQTVSYGDGVRDDWVDATTETCRGWLHQLAESEQQTATRDAEVSTHVLRVPSGTNIISSDRIRVDGQLFDVDGPPSQAWSPRGEHHVRVPLRYTQG